MEGLYVGIFLSRGQWKDKGQLKSGGLREVMVHLFSFF